MFQVLPWHYNEQTRTLMQKNKCLTVGAKDGIYTSQLLKCEKGNTKQEWVFTKFNGRGLKYEDLGNEKLAGK